MREYTPPWRQKKWLFQIQLRRDFTSRWVIIEKTLQNFNLNIEFDAVKVNSMIEEDKQYIESVIADYKAMIFCFVVL